MSGLEEVSREELLVLVVAQARTIESLTQRVVELERQLKADSSNSSRPPSSDPPWVKKSAKKRSSRAGSGRKPGKQPGSSSVSRSLSDDPDAVFEVAPDRCAKCEKSLHGAEETSRGRRQVVDVSPPPPPAVTEYQVVSRRCGDCGHVSEPTATDVPREVTPGTVTDTDGEYSSEPATAPESGEGAESAAADGPGGAVTALSDRVSVPVGARVRLRVESESLGIADVHGYDVVFEGGPGTPGTADFTADITGIFDVELHEADRRLLELAVS